MSWHEVIKITIHRTFNNSLQWGNEEATEYVRGTKKNAFKNLHKNSVILSNCPSDAKYLSSEYQMKYLD